MIVPHTVPTAFVGTTLSILLLSHSFGQVVEFADVTLEAGMDISMHGQGVCVFDYDRDGLEDVFISDAYGEHRLFRNLGGLLFEESLDAAGIPRGSGGRLTIAGDVNGDGFADLFVGSVSDATESRLYRNNGDGTFNDYTAEAGISVSGDVRGGIFFDYDLDGGLDLYIGRLKELNILYRNNGDGTFTDVTSRVNAHGPTIGGLVMGVAALDTDRDGQEDIFITQDGYKGNILLKKDHYDIFHDRSLQSGIDLEVQGMGVAIGDYDRDGFLDLYTSNLNKNTLFKNVGNGTFANVTDAAGVGDSDGSMAWGTLFFDADNDGWVDLFNNNESSFGQIPNSFFRNVGDGTFEDLSLESGLEAWNNGFGCAYGDLDLDGDLDLVAVGAPSVHGSIKLYENRSSENNWITLDLRSLNGGGQAIGAIVELYSTGGQQTSFVAAGNGYCSQNSFLQHFGLGQDSVVDSVIVSWPGGGKSVLRTPRPNQLHTIIQGTTVSLQSPQTPSIEAYSLHSFPNPFNTGATISFAVPKGRSFTLAVYDFKGGLVLNFGRGRSNGGLRTFQWDGSFTDGSPVPSGVYLCRLEAGVQSKTIRLVVIR